MACSKSGVYPDPNPYPWNVHSFTSENDLPLRIFIYWLINRTNNPLERFNRKTNDSFPTHHPTMMSFVEIIRWLCKRLNQNHRGIYDQTCSLGSNYLSQSWVVPHFYTINFWLLTSHVRTLVYHEFMILSFYQHHSEFKKMSFLKVNQGHKKTRVNQGQRIVRVRNYKSHRLS